MNVSDFYSQKYKDTVKSHKTHCACASILGSQNRNLRLDLNNTNKTLVQNQLHFQEFLASISMEATANSGDTLSVDANVKLAEIAKLCQDEILKMTVKFPQMPK